MRNATDPAAGGLDASRVFCAFVTDHWLANHRCHAQLARAIALRKPIFLLLLPGVRVPESLAHGAEDLAVFRVPRLETGAGDVAAAAVWVHEQLQARGIPVGHTGGDDA